ncbi:6-phospho-beta-glucosidase [Pseudoflavonifractor sp. BIOML-A6]|nr:MULTISPECIES: 6-phospho-beta-glucosidase [unclassified Pseudoflavonifractor]MTQ97609.1 6-phospho-beta-glucosidase [Pseudoflavonifractor sp. BIOML-A16]MTR07817.1 6-phospho-beta-glucosidase [Pseudoflavonifractor sp. BIOML-A15]MTR31764.1 6-phospho-beta-glucosidase [Pseudoflavonifractor sp. BIOML-A14]MTR73519.1 6-phospho-beta-glucosidase [Pseudoflavonifractor sp. BIOML-A18]MTS65966.1 6-phospho-beta-glucosidase [Pseudoflavonifractor sp. BIOML-A5]MTS73402.1 6-phospho-beta-glucosidase [Pseudoflav
MKKNSLKIAVVGGGSSYTPELIEGILVRQDHLPVRELVLVDVPMGAEKVSIIESLARRMAAKAGADIHIHATMDRPSAIRGADFVITQFRVGGLDARAKDESIPLKYDIIGQETTGPGGYAKALRTIPVILDICREIEELAPDAWLINFTNPSGIVTEAILNHTRVKALGLCNVPIGAKKDIAKALKVDFSRVQASFMGLNHMGYIYSATVDGVEVLPQLIEMFDDPPAGVREHLESMTDIIWPMPFLRSLGMLTSPYHRYYHRNRMMLEEEKAHMAEKGSRAMQVKAIEKELFEKYKSPHLCEKPKELEQRGGAYYSEAAISLIDAIYGDKGEIHTVNLQNRGTISNLPYNAVIEANAIIGAGGATPLVIGEMPTRVAGLVNEVKAYEQLAVKAAVEQDYDIALSAMLANPFINDYEVGKTILDELVEAHSPYLDYLKR